MSFRIVTLSGRGLPTGVDADGYDTRLAAEAQAENCHDGEFQIFASCGGGRHVIGDDLGASGRCACRRVPLTEIAR